jgi:acetyl esterase/lipase
LAEADENGKVAFQFPVQLHDAKCAVRWMRANASKYKIDPDRIGAVGSSAGGQLALMLGLTKPSDDFEGNGGHAEQSSSVAVVAHWAGPIDMAGFYHGTNEIVVPFVVRYLGGTPKEVPEQYKAASPLSYVTDKAPPILSIHGEIDDAVPIQGTKDLDKAMKADSAEHERLILEGQGHSYDSKSMQRGTEAMYKFLDKHLKH